MMASASWRETGMRLPPRVAQPRPSAVTSSAVRPILRLSKTAISVSHHRRRRVVRTEYIGTSRFLVANVRSCYGRRSACNGSATTTSFGQSTGDDRTHAYLSEWERDRSLDV